MRPAPRPPSRRAMGMPFRVVAVQSVRGVPSGRGPVGCVCHGSDSVIGGTLSAHNRLRFNGAATASGLLLVRRSQARRRAGRDPGGSLEGASARVGRSAAPRRSAKPREDRVRNAVRTPAWRDNRLLQLQRSCVRAPRGGLDSERLAGPKPRRPFVAKFTAPGRSFHHAEG